MYTMHGASRRFLLGLCARCRSLSMPYVSVVGSPPFIAAFPRGSTRWAAALETVLLTLLRPYMQCPRLKKQSAPFGEGLKFEFHYDIFRILVFAEL